jgi:hypothetical protein
MFYYLDCQRIKHILCIQPRIHISKYSIFKTHSRVASQQDVQLIILYYDFMKHTFPAPPQQQQQQVSKCWWLAQRVVIYGLGWSNLKKARSDGLPHSQHETKCKAVKFMFIWNIKVYDRLGFFTFQTTISLAFLWHGGVCSPQTANNFDWNSYRLKHENYSTFSCSIDWSSLNFKKLAFNFEAFIFLNWSLVKRTWNNLLR